MAERLRQRSAKPCTAVRIRSRPQSPFERKGFFLIPMYLNTETTTSLALYLLIGFGCFYLYWFFSISERINLLYQKKNIGDQWYANRVFHSKLFGALTMGTLPFIALEILNINPWFKMEMGLIIKPDKLPLALYLIIGYSILWIPFAYFQSKSPKHQKHFPQIRTKQWNKIIFMKAISGWVIYLIGYEVLFRSLLLFPFVSVLGPALAIALNTALYSAAHLPKGFGETIGSIIVGLFFGYVAVETEMILPVIIMHWVMSISNLFFSLKHHPEIRL